MQEVPNPECDAVGSSGHETAVVRCSRIPRVRLLPNKSDQRVPLYFDQTVPVWPVREHHPRGGNHSTTASPLSRSPSSAPHADGGGRHAQSRGFGVRKPERGAHAVWFRSLKGVLKASSAEAHACNASEILRDFACERTSTWSGIEQDLFTCTSVDPKVFADPASAELFNSNKESKIQSSSKE